MITIGEYNNAEALAIERLPGLYKDNKWGSTPETQSHLVWAKEYKDLQILLNRFQCDRFRSYFFELGGLSRDDLAAFNAAKYTIVDIQRRYYPEIEPVVPVETLLSAFTIYRKIKTARPETKSILEIGPGAGLNSLFFAQDETIKFYTQVEATQATYLSQAMVNERCYGPFVCEMALSTDVTPGNKDKCCHVPWWRVDEIHKMSVCYDVITANACINEISDAMVDRYLELFAARSHENTLLLLQDLGDFMFRSDLQLLDRLKTAGWFLAGETRNWDIEQEIANLIGAAINHGDAVTTWWLTKYPDEFILKLVPRYLDGSDENGYWPRHELAKIN